MRTGQTGYVYHEIFGWHDTGTFVGDKPSDPAAGLQPYVNYENSDTKRRIHELIVVSGLITDLHRIEPRPATETELALVHTDAHIDRIKHESNSRLGGDGGDLGTPFAKGGYDIAVMAVGGAIELTRNVLSGTVRNGYALIRPPGHHAIADAGMGYCLFSNLSISISAAKLENPALRVVTVDWDVHHGNGTQDIFAKDPNVLTISIHQNRLFPHHTGDRSERGVGPGFGSNINVPLPPGTGNGGYLYAFNEVVIPAIKKFKPDLIAVSSGFDSCVFDPLGRMLVTASGYQEMTKLLMSVADEICQGRIVMLHEGGYNAVYSPFCGLFVLQELSGSYKLDDPFGDTVNNYPGQELMAHQKNEIDLSAKLLVDIP
jgi:acetoin utilization deacetylase AcuC-like enzyme